MEMSCLVVEGGGSACLHAVACVRMREIDVSRSSWSWFWATGAGDKKSPTCEHIHGQHAWYRCIV